MASSVRVVKQDGTVRVCCSRKSAQVTAAVSGNRWQRHAQRSAQRQHTAQRYQAPTQAPAPPAQGQPRHAAKPWDAEPAQTPAAFSWPRAALFGGNSHDDDDPLAKLRMALASLDGADATSSDERALSPQPASPEPKFQWGDLPTFLGVAVGLHMMVYPSDVQKLSYEEAFTPAPTALTSIVRDEGFAFDVNKDGIMQQEELAEIDKKLWFDWVEAAPPLVDSRPGMSQRLFDLNQDGQITNGEITRALALDKAVSNVTGQLEPEVFEVFDRNRDGRVDEVEWSQALGVMGQSGERAKAAVFDWAIVRQGDAEERGLDPWGLQGAMAQMKSWVFGGRDDGLLQT